jgi:DNA topoisomerase-3
VTAVGTQTPDDESGSTDVNQFMDELKQMVTGVVWQVKRSNGKKHHHRGRLEKPKEKAPKKGNETDDKSKQMICPACRKGS